MKKRYSKGDTPPKVCNKCILLHRIYFVIPTDLYMLNAPI